MRKDLSHALWIAAGGSLGALARHGLESAARNAPLGDNLLPYATFGINVSGAFLLGWIMARAARSPGGGDWLRSFGGIGFCGAFTTFSTMNLEMVEMVTHGRWPLAVAYFASSFLCGIGAAWVGARWGIPKREALQ